MTVYFYLLFYVYIYIYMLAQDLPFWCQTWNIPTDHISLYIYTKRIYTFSHGMLLISSFNASRPLPKLKNAAPSVVGCYRRDLRWKRWVSTFWFKRFAKWEAQQIWESHFKHFWGWFGGVTVYFLPASRLKSWLRSSSNWGLGEMTAKHHIMMCIDSTDDTPVGRHWPADFLP